MRKLLNTLYLTQENHYLSRNRENLVVKLDGIEIARFPHTILEQIVCFSYIGISPSAMQLCMENNINVSFISQSGYYCGSVLGKTNGNVLLRREQYRIADDNIRSLDYARRQILAKVSNSRKYAIKFKKDHKSKLDVEKFESINSDLLKLIKMIRKVSDKDSLRGLEGTAANLYFSLFKDLNLSGKSVFDFISRTKRPPMDCINALLSFGYTLLTRECSAALETVGLDCYVGFFHTDRPGRESLSLDLVEEFRSYLVDRFVFSLINLKQISEKDFEIKENGSVLLNDKGRKIFLSKWKERKDKLILHPYIDEKIKIGLLPYVQAQLLAKSIRGDISGYPPFLI